MSAVLKLNLNDEFVENMKHAVYETFRQIYGAPPIFGETHFSEELHVIGDISGIIDLVQEKVTGSLIICFQKQHILPIAERIYRKPMNEIDKSVAACVSELCNMTYGVFKKHMNLRGYQYKMSLPHVVQGESHRLWNNDVGTIIEIPITMGELSFVVILTLSKKDD